MYSKAKTVLCLCLIGLLAEKSRAAEDDKKGLLPDAASCGKQKATGTGPSAQLGEFPWVVLLRYANKDGKDGGFRCVGSLINGRYVLTTAVCAEPEGVALSSVRLGEHNLNTEKDCADKEEKECSTVEDIGIEQKIVHNNFSRADYDNDIALIRLNKTIEFTDYIKPICLPLSEATHAKAGDEVVASGWGRSITGDLITIKKRVTSVIVTKEECNEDYKPAKREVTDNQLCTKAHRNNTEYTCQGDSGGPLMFFSGDQCYQEGVTSFGIGCGYKLADGNTKVVNFVPWILENILP